MQQKQITLQKGENWLFLTDIHFKEVQAGQIEASGLQSAQPTLVTLEVDPDQRGALVCQTSYNGNRIYAFLDLHAKQPTSPRPTTPD